MKNLLILLTLLLMGVSAPAQNKPATTTPPAVVSLVEGITDKRFLPDTAFAALSEEDQTLLAKEPVANWGLPQESGQYMTYYNLVIGTRSYQLVVTRAPRSSYPTATLLRFTTPKSKPEPIARGTLRPKEEKPK
ncbi:hypothetical protein [Spirosoma sordidisoli]|uniref:DUF4377 domain-containing protein n=1 Tax=Spirosoma sordidisoli TaxID=2502893 RepID=A0A4Q2UQ53_9BACT|nr:hypothetical protein [Spirosoma sordidisoli]RYC68919.1 hypothetical protein EQG79_16060 [Spirosoma sordidisoli]